jgi:TPR repeat protein
MSVGPSTTAPPPRPAGRYDGQEALEADYLRMCRLRRMSSVELHALLAGDPAKAAPWIATAARYGLTEAQVCLGQMRLDGLGAPKDEDEALNWFLRAAKGGAPEAMNMVGRCYENGWGTGIDLAAAAHWYSLSAQAGHDWGEYNYANMLFDGRGVDGDREQAVDWYRRASEQGHARAMNLLARCYEEGWGVARNEGEAAEWYRCSADLGYFRAQYNHATLLAARGQIDEALQWFEAACRAATPDSRPAMVDALVRNRDVRLAELGRRLAASVA